MKKLYYTYPPDVKCCPETIYECILTINGVYIRQEHIYIHFNWTYEEVLVCKEATNPSPTPWIGFNDYREAFQYFQYIRDINNKFKYTYKPYENMAESYRFNKWEYIMTFFDAYMKQHPKDFCLKQVLNDAGYKEI